MKRFQRITAILAVLSLLIIPQTGCGAKEPASDTTFLLNTVCRVSLYEPADPELVEEALALCRDYEQLLSRTIETSDVGRINRAAGQAVAVDPRTAEVIKIGLRYGDLSGGLFDITVGRLSDLWDFSGDSPRVPSGESIDACLPHIDYRGVEAETAAITRTDGRPEGERTASVRLADPQAELDLGGVAKGYIADRLAKFLRSRGVSRAIIDLGGNIVAIGEKADGTAWNIGIEMPFSDRKEVIGSVALRDQSIVTSGIYERQFTENGRLYHHVLDPETGYPRETDLEAVSIIGTSSADCDALSTTCLMLGTEKARALIDSLPDFEAIFIDENGEVSMTKGVELNTR